MAGSLNKAILIGRLGRDPDLRYTTTGQPVAKFSIATDESYTGKDGKKVDKTEWHRIVVWGKQAEFYGHNLTKGRLVCIEGRLETSKWVDKDGVEKYTTEIKADRIQFLDSRQSDTGYIEAPRGEKGYESTFGQSSKFDEDLGPAFPSEASGMDDAPF